MKNKPITKYNANAIKEINKYLEFDSSSDNPIRVEYSFEDFESIAVTIRTLLNAIETIGYSGSSTKDLGLCAGLAEIANKLLPLNELDFLDRLLLNSTTKENNFIDINLNSK